MRQGNPPTKTHLFFTYIFTKNRRFSNRFLIVLHVFQFLNEKSCRTIMKLFSKSRFWNQSVQYWYLHHPALSNRLGDLCRVLCARQQHRLQLQRHQLQPQRRRRLQRRHQQHQFQPQRRRRLQIRLQQQQEKNTLIGNYIYEEHNAFNKKI